MVELILVALALELIWVPWWPIAKASHRILLLLV